MILRVSVGIHRYDTLWQPALKKNRALGIEILSRLVTLRYRSVDYEKLSFTFRQSRVSDVLISKTRDRIVFVQADRNPNREDIGLIGNEIRQSHGPLHSNEQLCRFKLIAYLIGFKQHRGIC